MEQNLHISTSSRFSNSHSCWLCWIVSLSAQKYLLTSVGWSSHPRLLAKSQLGWAGQAERMGNSRIPKGTCRHEKKAIREESSLKPCSLLLRILGLGLVLFQWFGPSFNIQLWCRSSHKFRNGLLIRNQAALTVNTWGCWLTHDSVIPWNKQVS